MLTEILRLVVLLKSSDHSDETLEMLANGLVNGVGAFLGY